MSTIRPCQHQRLSNVVAPDFRRSSMQQDPSVRFLKKASMCSILMAAKMSSHESQNVISPLESSLSFPDVILTLLGECRDCRYGGSFKLPRVQN